MAASTRTTPEPLLRTLFRFMHAVRQENTQHAVQLLNSHSDEEKGHIVSRTVSLIPSSDRAIRSLIQSVYLNNESASHEDIKEALLLVLRTESRRLVYNLVIESSPLLSAIKQGDVDKIRLLLQQLPRKEAINISFKGPDAKLILSLKTKVTEYADRLYNDILRKYSLNDKFRRMVSTRMLCDALNTAISDLSKFNAWVSGLVLATSRGSLDIIMLLLQYMSYDAPDLFYVIDSWYISGSIIASHSTDRGVDLTKTLLNDRPEHVKQKVCIDWLIRCVSGGVCGVEVISLILKSIKWDVDVKNVIIGLLINTWDFKTDKDVLVALLQCIPDNEIVTTLTINFDDQKFTTHNDLVLYKQSGSTLYEELRNGDIDLIQSCLSIRQVQNILDYVESSPNTVTSDVLALCERHLIQYFIPEHPQAKLQGYGVICYNEGLDDLIRTGAEVEAQTMTTGLTDAGINMKTDLKNWSTYSLLQRLRNFCEEIRENCALAVVCIMAHGKAGLIYSNSSSSDRCRITDILSILDERLPSYIPKVVIVQACQGLVDGRDRADESHSRHLLDAVFGTDASSAKSGNDDYENIHVENKLSNTTLLLSALHGQDAHRNNFIPALAEEIGKADGVRSVYDMFITASHKMRGQPDAKYRKQIPEYRSSNRKKLILPRKLTHGELQVEGKLTQNESVATESQPAAGLEIGAEKPNESIESERAPAVPKTEISRGDKSKGKSEKERGGYKYICAVM